MAAAQGAAYLASSAPSMAKAEEAISFSLCDSKADAESAAEASPRKLVQLASDMLGGFAGAVLPRTARTLRARSAPLKQTAPPSALGRSPFPSLLRALAECVERLEQLRQEADFRAELGYLMGDLELLLAELEREPSLTAAAHAIRELLRRFRERAAETRERVLELVHGAHALLDRLLAGELPPDAGPPAKRKDFWK
jgi:hypothetical protein